MCDVSFIFVTWHIHTCNTNHMYVWNITRVTRIIYMCDVSHVWDESCTCLVYHIYIYVSYITYHMWNTDHIYVWYFTCDIRHVWYITRMYMIRIADVNVACYTYEWVMAHKQNSERARHVVRNVARSTRRTFEWVADEFCPWMSHVAWTNVVEWVMSH